MTFLYADAATDGFGLARNRKSEVDPWCISMNRQRALDLLRRSKPELQAQFGVTRLALFGSTARDAASTNSDVDVLVAFDGPATSRRYFGVQFYLEDLLGCPIDLVTEKALRPELRPYIERERLIV
ncbi:MAG: nucleotidyltransferase family protein [Pseudomonadales bacterium]|jgi:predicted nucleotidyltransferase